MGGVPIRCCEGRAGTWAKNRRKELSGARGLGQKQPLQITLAGEPLPAIGGFVLAQSVPELLSEEGPREQHWSGEIEQGAEVGVLLDGQIKWVLAVQALWAGDKNAELHYLGAVADGNRPRSLQTRQQGWEGRSAFPL